MSHVKLQHSLAGLMSSFLLQSSQHHAAWSPSSLFPFSSQDLRNLAPELPHNSLLHLNATRASTAVLPGSCIVSQTGYSFFSFAFEKNYFWSLSASGLRDRLEIQGSRVQTRLRSMDFFQEVKILSTGPPGEALSLRFQVR